LATTFFAAGLAAGFLGADFAAGLALGLATTFFAAGLTADLATVFLAAGLLKIFPNSATKTTFQSDDALKGLSN
jgi:hypothetical protein